MKNVGNQLVKQLLSSHCKNNKTIKAEEHAVKGKVKGLHSSVGASNFSSESKITN